MNTPPPPDSQSPRSASTTSQENKEYDFQIIADGSGFTDHFGGFGAIVVSGKYGLYLPSCGCSTHMETGRAEFTAILTGLHSIIDHLKWNDKGSLKALAAAPPTLLITSDREDLVGSINKVFERRSNADLWAQFGWYESYFAIQARHVKRDTNAWHNRCDVLASEMRIVLIDYYKIQSETNHI